MAATRTVLAAGAVVWRPGLEDLELLVVHRTRHQDWTLPKGKLDPGEVLPVTAVREVLEETAVPIRLGLPLRRVDYPVGDPPALKKVSYWVGRPLGDGSVDRPADDEVDEVRWVPVREITDLLTYEPDRGLVAQLLELQQRSWHRGSPLVILRHGQAQPREGWTGDDRLRPLADGGLREAHRLVPLLAAFGVARVVSSDAVRCTQTVAPYAEHLGVDVEVDAGLDEERSSTASVVARLRDLAGSRTPSVLCTHRQVLPLVLDALGIEQQALEPGELLVAHRHRGRVVGVERHRP